MAKYGSDDVGFFLIDGYDVLGVTTNLSDDVEALTEETTPLGVGWQELGFTGLKKGALTQNGFFDDAAGSSNAALNEKQGTARVTVYGIEGNTIGQNYVGWAGAMQMNYERLAARGELHKANARYESSGAVEEGKIIGTHATRTTAGDTESTPVDGGMQAAAVSITSSSVDNPTVITCAAAHGLLTGDSVLIAGHSGSTPDINGTHVATVTADTTYTIPVNVTVGGTGGTSTRISSRDGGFGYLQVSALTLGGYDNLTVKLRDSLDDVTYADLDTFTVVTTSPTAERTTITGNIERYVAMSWAWTGSGSGQTAKFMVGLIRS